MTRLKTIAPGLMAVALVLLFDFAATASTFTLGSATGYNVFTLGDFDPTGADTLGKVAVGGNFNGVSYVVGSALHDTASTLDFIVAGNLTDSAFSMTGGGIYVGGNATLSSATTGNLYVNGNLSTGNSSLTFNSAAVNGNINAGSGGFSNTGNIYTLGSFTAGYANSTVFYGNSASYGGPNWVAHTTENNAAGPLQVPSTPINFYSAQTSLGSSSNGLSGMIANAASNGAVKVSGNGGLTLTGSDASQNVFSITVAQLNAAMTSVSSGITVNAPAGAVVLINVTGTAGVDLASNSLVLNGVSASDVLFNFSQTHSITYGSVGLNASFLAPVAAFNGTGGQLDGELIAASVTGVTEFHNDYLFNGAINVANVSATPEPSTFAAGFAFIAVSLVLRRCKGRSKA